MRFLAALLACLSTSALAATATTDFSDLWWNPNEDGWGVTLTQQNQVLFVTLYVFQNNHQPKWFVGPATQYQGADANGMVTFSGPLFETTGSDLGGAWNPGDRHPSQVGTITFTASQISVGTLAYTVNGVSVAKTITRQIWQYENISGVYVGASLGRFAGCGGRDGYFESPATLTVAHDGLHAITVKEEGNGYTCNYAGAYAQLGRMGQISGTGSCTDGPAQSFTATEVMGSVQGLSMRFGVQFAGACTSNGRMGGVRRGS
jgi:hypothetical protein